MSIYYKTHILQYPLTQQKSKIIKPGFINDVSIDAVKVMAKNEIKAAATSELRGCLFEDERELKFHQFYSESNCLLECKMEYAMNEMKSTDPCVPWYFPSR